MSTDRTYTLQKYAGRSTRHTCPQCGRPHCFTRYVDPDGNILDETVGRCDHESSCGYHRTPKQYFRDHPELSRTRQPQPAPRPSQPRHTAHSPLCTIPQDILRRSVRKDIPSTFTAFLRTIFPEDTVAALTDTYRLGVTRSRDVIYFQIDTAGRIRTGKIMKYDPATGRRIKDPGTPFRIGWVHSLMKRTGQLPPGWQLTQCLFGEHLLSKDSTLGNENEYTLYALFTERREKYTPASDNINMVNALLSAEQEGAFRRICEIVRIAQSTPAF